MDILSEDEKELLSSPGIFKAKRSLEKKMKDLLEDTSRLLQAESCNNAIAFPDEVLQIAPKVSRGESYLNYPWMILDFPRYFTKQEVFAIRTFCWWTQGISITLQLSGVYLEQYYPFILAHTDLMLKENIHIGVHQDPWVHHFETDNFIQPASLKELFEITDDARKRGFLKLMKRYPLEELNGLPEHAIHFFQLANTLCSSKS